MLQPWNMFLLSRCETCDRFADQDAGELAPALFQKMRPTTPKLDTLNKRELDNEASR